MPKSRSRSSSSTSSSSSKSSSSSRSSKDSKGRDKKLNIHAKSRHKSRKKDKERAKPSLNHMPEVMRFQDDDTLKKRIFIANIRTEVVTEKDLQDLFSPYGKILGININMKGFAFIQFSEEKDAQRAVLTENGNYLKGKRLAINMSLDNRKGRNDTRSRSPVRRPPPNDDQVSQEMSHFARGRDPLPVRGVRDYLPPLRDYPPLERRMPFLDPLARDPLYDRYRLYPIDDPLYARRDPLYRDIDRYDRLPPPIDVPPAPSRPPPECQIIILSQQLREYGEAVERRIKNIGIFTELVVLPADRTLQEAIDEVASQSFLYAIVITQQNEMHRSLTLNILHGKPQVHRNMPLDESITLVEKTFEKYLSEKKDQGAATGHLSKDPFIPPDDNTLYLLNLLADNRALTVEEIDKIIAYLTERRTRLVRGTGESSTATPLEKDNHQASEESQSNIVLSRKQQDDLQAKINNLFPPKQVPVGQPGMANSVASLVNFDNPSVQKALDNLIQDPSVLQNIAGPRDHMTGPRNTIAGSREDMAGTRDPMVGARDPMASMRDPMAGMRNPMAGMRDPMNNASQTKPHQVMAKAFAASEQTQLAYSPGTGYGSGYFQGPPYPPRPVRMPFPRKF